jgi:hypothetical protein
MGIAEYAHFVWAAILLFWRNWWSVRLIDVVGAVWWGWGGQSRSAAEFLDIRVWGENWWKD